MIITPKEFQKQFKRLLLSRVQGMDWEDKLARVRQYLRELEARQSPEEESVELNPSVEIIPFEPGKRPLDEALYLEHGALAYSALPGPAVELYMNSFSQAGGDDDERSSLEPMQQLVAVGRVENRSDGIAPMRLRVSRRDR